MEGNEEREREVRKLEEGGEGDGLKGKRESACVRVCERERVREREIVAFDLKLLPLSLHLPSSHSFPENASKSEGRFDKTSQTCKKVHTVVWINTII